MDAERIGEGNEQPSASNSVEVLDRRDKWKYGYQGNGVECHHHISRHHSFALGWKSEDKQWIHNHNLEWS